jgi:hypothetical protein
MALESSSSETVEQKMSTQMYVVIYPFKGVNPGELDVHPGDHVAIHTERDGWYYGSKVIFGSGKIEEVEPQGWFPKSHCTEMS